MNRLSKTIQSARCPEASAVIVAAGSGMRFGADKLFADLDGAPVLARSLMAFENTSLIREIILVARKDALDAVGELCRTYGITKVKVIVPGGATRALSSYAGVMSASETAEILAIHDGARPLVTPELIENAVWDAYRHGAAVPAIPVKDTIKKAENRVVCETPDRAKLFAVQTPQCFQRDLICGALAEAVKNAPEITDDCAAVERIGGQIWLSEGSEENIKITTPLDMTLAEMIWNRRQEI